MNATRQTDPPPIDDDEPALCNDCAGSGEGHFDGTTCRACKGLGEINHHKETV